MCFTPNKQDSPYISLYMYMYILYSGIQNRVIYYSYITLNIPVSLLDNEFAVCTCYHQFGAYSVSPQVCNILALISLFPTTGPLLTHSGIGMPPPLGLPPPPPLPRPPLSSVTCLSTHSHPHPRPFPSIRLPQRASEALILRKVPRELNSITKLSAHFEKFGTIVNLTVRCSV